MLISDAPLLFASLCQVVECLVAFPIVSMSGLKNLWLVDSESYAQRSEAHFNEARIKTKRVKKLRIMLV